MASPWDKFYKIEDTSPFLITAYKGDYKRLLIFMMALQRNEIHLPIELKLMIASYVCWDNVPEQEKNNYIRKQEAVKVIRNLIKLEEWIESKRFKFLSFQNRIMDTWKENSKLVTISMGLGKTAMAIGQIREYFNNFLINGELELKKKGYLFRHVLIIVQAQHRQMWLEEIRRVLKDEWWDIVHLISGIPLTIIDTRLSIERQNQLHKKILELELEEFDTKKALKIEKLKKELYIKIPCMSYQDISSLLVEKQLKGEPQIVVMSYETLRTFFKVVPFMLNQNNDQNSETDESDNVEIIDLDKEEDEDEEEGFHLSNTTLISKNQRLESNEILNAGMSNIDNQFINPEFIKLEQRGTTKKILSTQINIPIDFKKKQVIIDLSLNISWLMILDEVTVLKNQNTQIFKSINYLTQRQIDMNISPFARLIKPKIPKKSRVLRYFISFLLTAMPIQTGLNDMRSYIKIIDPFNLEMSKITYWSGKQPKIYTREGKDLYAKFRTEHMVFFDFEKNGMNNPIKVPKPEEVEVFFDPNSLSTKLYLMLWLLIRADYSHFKKKIAEIGWIYSSNAKQARMEWLRSALPMINHLLSLCNTPYIIGAGRKYLNLKELYYSIYIQNITDYRSFLSSILSERSHPAWQYIENQDLPISNWKILAMFEALFCQDLSTMFTSKFITPKIQVILDRLGLELTQDPKSKIIIFSDSVVFGKVLIDIAISPPWNFDENIFILLSSFSSSQKQTIINQFNSPSSLQRVIVAHPSSAFGFSLSGANIVFWCNPPWSHAQRFQANHRILRLTQKRTDLKIIYFRLHDSAEDWKETIIQSKKCALECILDESNQSGNFMNKKSLSLAYDDVDVLFTNRIRPRGAPVANENNDINDPSEEEESSIISEMIKSLDLSSSPDISSLVSAYLKASKPQAVSSTSIYASRSLSFTHDMQDHSLIEDEDFSSTPSHFHHKRKRIPVRSSRKRLNSNDKRFDSFIRSQFEHDVTEDALFQTALQYLSSHNFKFP